MWLLGILGFDKYLNSNSRVMKGEKGGLIAYGHTYTGFLNLVIVK